MNNLNLGLLFVFLLLMVPKTYGEELSFTADQSPEEEAVQVIDNDNFGPVDVISKTSFSGSYKERRSNTGFFFDIGADNFYPEDYQSLIDNKFYTDLFGEEDLTLLQLETGFQWNTGIGSFAASLMYAQGSLEDDRIGNLRWIEVTKPAVRIAYQMDTLWSEPYVVPYGALSFWQMSLKEESTSGSTVTQANKQTGFGMTMTAGALVQLNWLDTDSALTAYQDYGLQNTYLNLAINQYGEAGDSSPSTFSDFNWSASLRLEF